MKKSIPLSVKVAEPSQPPNFPFLSDKSRAWVMGVLNATPDSFYAASRGHFPNEAPDILDIGGESTRPGAEEISENVELERVLPMIDEAREKWPNIPISIDTRKANVAFQALKRGANVINDISALRHDPEMADVVADAACPVVLMHMQGTPETMQIHPQYEHVVDEVKHFFEERLGFASRHNISEDRVILDPGIGFGKTLEHNLMLLKSLKEFLSLGRPLLVGVSRKSFIGRLLGRGERMLPPEERLEGSLSAALWAVKEGASGLRVHDVSATRRMLQIWEGIQAA